MAAAAAAVACLAPATSQAALRDELVAHLPFDGNANDTTSRANNGTLVGAPTFAAGALGQGVFCSNTLDGTEANYVSLGTVPDVLFGDATDFSVVMWVQLNDFLGDPSFFGNKNWVSGSNRGYVLATGDDRRIQWNFKEMDTGRRDFDGAPNALPSGTWVHVAMTVNRDGKISTYIDGQQINQTDARPAADTPASTVDTDDLGLSVNIGNDGTGQYTDGGSVNHGNTGIDDFGLWRRELSGAEVFRIYTFGRGGTNIANVPEPTGASIDSTTPLAGARDVSPSTPIQVAIANAGTAVVPSTIALTFNGAPVVPVLATNGSLVTATYQPPALLPPSSTNSFRVVFADDATPPRRTTNDVTFVVRNYPNLVLGTPFVSENFEGVAEGALPAGWSVTNATAGATGTADLDDFRSDAYLDWVVINTNRVPTLVAAGASDADIGLVAPDQYVNGVAVTTLLNNQFVLAQSTDRSAQQIQMLFSADFNATGRSNVFLYFHSAHKANQDSMFAVEYSVDGGATWNPALYALDGPDIVRAADGSIDALATFNSVRGDVPAVDGSATGGGTYGAFVGAPISQALAPFLSARVNDNGVESKRVEFIRLVAADNQARVRLRFVNVGTDSWYSAIDDVRLYSVIRIDPPQITTAPVPATIVAGQSGRLSGTVSGSGVQFQWFRNGSAVPNATNSVLPFNAVSASAAGDYSLVASNGGGSVTSAPVALSVPLPLGDLAPVRAGLRAYLPFNDSYADASGNGNNAEPRGAPGFSAGRFGSGLAFASAADGSSFNYATLGSSFLTSTQSFSVSFWAKLDAWTGDPGFIGNKNWNSGSNDGWIIATGSDGRIQWNLRNKGDPRPSRRDFDSAGGYFNGAAWRHIVVVFDQGGNASTYVDGDLIDSRPITPTGTGPDTTLALNIGQDGTGTYTDGGGVSSRGVIDEVAIWGRALSQVEAASIYQVNRAGTPLATPAVPAAMLSAALAGPEITISWTGGTAPFLVQATSELDEPWVNLITTTNRSVTVPRFGDGLFFRVISGATNSVRLFKAILTGEAERPNPVTTPGSGAGVVGLEGSALWYHVEYRDLKAATTAAHIHGPAPASGTAGVLLGLMPDSPLGRSGTFDGNATITSALESALEAGQAYFNVHTAPPLGHAGGEIRGQLIRVH